MKDAARPRIHVVLATSDIHLKYKLRISRDQCVQQARESIRFAKSLCNDVEFSPEDATRTDTDFLCRVLDAADFTSGVRPSPTLIATDAAADAP